MHWADADLRGCGYPCNPVRVETKAPDPKNSMHHRRDRLSFSARVARAVLLAAQRTRFRGVGGYSPEAYAARHTTNRFPQATREASLYHEFFEFFPQEFGAEALLTGRIVLDFGCGYGGRTVEYARRGGARYVYGVEPAPRHTELAQQYARSVEVCNVEFRTCGETSVPLPDGAVDVVISYDVLEHVRSPAESIAELFRVLKPGGTALLVFPVYLGIRSHHLDYITTLPGTALAIQCAHPGRGRELHPAGGCRSVALRHPRAA